MDSLVLAFETDAMCQSKIINVFFFFCFFFYFLFLFLNLAGSVDGKGRILRIFHAKC